jgi:hypothetical protein
MVQWLKNWTLINLVNAAYLSAEWLIAMEATAFVSGVISGSLNGRLLIGTKVA